MWLQWLKLVLSVTRGHPGLERPHLACNRVQAVANAVALQPQSHVIREDERERERAQHPKAVLIMWSFTAMLRCSRSQFSWRKSIVSDGRSLRWKFVNLPRVLVCVCSPKTTIRTRLIANQCIILCEIHTYVIFLHYLKLFAQTHLKTANESVMRCDFYLVINAEVTTKTLPSYLDVIFFLLL